MIVTDIPDPRLAQAPDDRPSDVVDELGLAGTPEGETLRSYLNFLEGAAEQALAQRDEAYERGLMHAVEHVGALLGHSVELHVSREAAEEMLAAALETARERGLREAAEGWEREWGLQDNLEPDPSGCAIRARSREEALTFGEGGDYTLVSRLVGPWEPAEQPEPSVAQTRAREVAQEVLTVLAAAIKAEVDEEDGDRDRLLLAEIFEAARPLVGNPVARPLVLPVAKLAQHMYRAAMAEESVPASVEPHGPQTTEEADRG